MQRTVTDGNLLSGSDMTGLAMINEIGVGNNTAGHPGGQGTTNGTNEEHGVVPLIDLSGNTMPAAEMAGTDFGAMMRFRGGRDAYDVDDQSSDSRSRGINN